MGGDGKGREGHSLAGEDVQSRLQRRHSALHHLELLIRSRQLLVRFSQRLSLRLHREHDVVVIHDVDD